MGYRPRRQYDLTRDAFHLMVYLSTSFFNTLGDLLGPDNDPFTFDLYMK